MFKKNERGFTLIELSIVMIISMMLLAATMWSRVNGVREEQAKIQGDAILVLSNAVGTYMTNNYTDLVNNTAITGYANIYAPTVPELIASGLLSNNFNATSIYGSAYQISVSRTPAACVPPACDVVSLVNLTAPITDYRTGLIDGPSLGAAANRVGANGGWSTRMVPGTISGTDGSWSAANPQGAVAGILGVRGGYGSSGWAQFLRRDGSLPMTGNLNMGNQNVNNANAVNSVTLATTGGATVGGNLSVAGATNTNGITNAGAINTTTLASTGGVTVGGNLGVGGNTTTNGITNTGAINTTTIATTGGATVGGALSVAGATTTNGIVNTGNITNSGDISTGRLVLNTVVTTGGSCTGLDGYQARTSTGSIASCVSGVWTVPSAGGGGSAACSTQTVGAWSATGGSGGSCLGTANATTSGTSVTVNATSGGTGSAQYMCNNGSWAWQSGTCTPTPCATQTVTWGSGCSGSATSVASGSTRSVTATSGSGTATFLCTAGNWSYQSGSCTATTTCPSGAVLTWQKARTTAWNSNPATVGTYTCSGTVTSSASAGSTTTVTASTSTRVGSATATCGSGGAWYISAVNSCDGNTRTISTTLLTSGTAVDNTYINCYKQGLGRYPSVAEKWWGQGTADCTTIFTSTEFQCAGGTYPSKTICPASEPSACGSASFAYPWTGPQTQTGSCFALPG